MPIFLVCWHPETKTGVRTVPLFGEVREILDRIVVNLGKNFVLADFVFVKLDNFWHRIAAVIQAAGVKKWVKLFVESSVELYNGHTIHSNVRNALASRLRMSDGKRSISC